MMTIPSSVDCPIWDWLGVVQQVPRATAAMKRHCLMATFARQSMHHRPYCRSVTPPCQSSDSMFFLSPSGDCKISNMSTSGLTWAVVLECESPRTNRNRGSLSPATIGPVAALVDDGGRLPCTDMNTVQHQVPVSLDMLYFV